MNGLTSMLYVSMAALIIWTVASAMISCSVVGDELSCGENGRVDGGDKDDVGTGAPDGITVLMSNRSAAACNRAGCKVQAGHD